MTQTAPTLQSFSLAVCESDLRVGVEESRQLQLSTPLEGAAKPESSDLPRNNEFSGLAPGLRRHMLRRLDRVVRRYQAITARGFMVEALVGLQGTSQSAASAKGVAGQ